MPHATAPHQSGDDDDEILIQQLLNAPTTEDPFGINRELEPGEKAEDAENYEDISDDDLADDEDVEGERRSQIGDGLQNGASSKSLEAFTQDVDFSTLINGNGLEDNEFDDDLFGEGLSSPVETNTGAGQTLTGHDQVGLSDFDDSTSLPAQPVPPPMSPLSRQIEAPGKNVSPPTTFTSKESPPSKELQRQQELLAMSRNGATNTDGLPAPPENREELLASLWPKFKRDTIPKFMELLPPKRARYLGKSIPKPPKPVNPTKISLELAFDQEKHFKVSSMPNRPNMENTSSQGIVAIQEDIVVEKDNEEDADMESDFENELVGGISWQDLQVICEDWDTCSAVESIRSELDSSRSYKASNPGTYEDVDVDADPDHGWPSAKRRKTDHLEPNVMRAPQSLFPSFQDPEQATSKIAKTVTLDLNDSRLLIDHVQPNAISRNVFGRSDLKRAGRGAFTKGLSQRYNISNDEAYDLLKENHQSKVRSMLGNVAVEHSLPAIRLQWPFYKTKLDKQDARSFHRPGLKVNRNVQVAFSKPAITKKKYTKGKDTQKLFPDSKALSLADNSNVLLLEYSEEYPTMLSNVGMGNRVINYYRRKTMDDTSRPKLDVGETGILLPQDKSPFSIFGHVDPGHITPTLHNGMYRAPIFKHTARNNDFLVVKNTTGTDGSAWYMRNIENLYVVGQEFPSVDVPGPHSRKVTTASKNRLKMISYRLIRKSKNNRISVGEVTSHFADTSDMQNRQKMKEFMQFNKEHKEWQMRSGEAIPDEETIRTTVKPEDVCLLESMQVGQQHLQDAGFNKEDDESEGDESKEGQSIEQQLAPWYTSRNFLHATQGKAMLTLHGEGDPTRRGEAFSFIKTSMKGGFKPVGASANEKMNARQMKESGGHAYNVQDQQRSYEESIRKIWEAQKQSLSSTVDQSESDMDENPIEEASNTAFRAVTPRSEAQTPATLRRRDDETTSQFTQASTGSQAGKILKITRHIQDEYGNVEPHTEIVRAPKVIRQYLKRRHAKEAETTGLTDIKPTGIAEQDRRNQQRLEKELARLQRNKERRIARDKQKGVHFDGAADEPGSPSSPANVPVKSAGTQRKCANCGQVGHIKTNKKLCPMLNGTMKQDEGFGSSAFTIGTPDS